MRWPNRIKVEVYYKNGSIHVEPLNALYRRLIVEYMRTWQIETDGIYRLHDEVRARNFIQDHLSRPNWYRVNRGYPITMMIDPWFYCNFFGWDCHTLVETGINLSEIKTYM
jgi:hypothetical protein